MHLEVLGQVPARAALHPPPEGVSRRTVRASRRARARLAAGKDAHAALN